MNGFFLLGPIVSFSRPIVDQILFTRKKQTHPINAHRLKSTKLAHYYHLNKLGESQSIYIIQLMNPFLLPTLASFNDFQPIHDESINIEQGINNECREPIQLKKQNSLSDRG